MNATPMQKRRTEATPQLRAATSGGVGNTLSGYAAKFGSLYELAPGLWETVSPKAFTRTLKEMPDVRALFNHDTSAVLGRTASGTLRLKEDSIGLGFTVDLPDTQVGRDVRELVKRGDITGCSFGFTVKAEKFEDRPDGTVLRTLLDVDLYEISPAVAFPAYEDTEVALRVKRHRADQPQPIREHCLRMVRLMELDD